jgi:hypothetical protein
MPEEAPVIQMRAPVISMRDSLEDVGMAARKGSGKRSGKPAATAGTVGHGEFVMYPGVPAGVYDLLERLSAAAGDSPDFGSPGISLDRTRVTVRWFGELPPAARSLVDAATGFDVAVESTEFRPGDLRAEAERLLREHAPAVTGATARPEGDGIDVLVAPAAAEAAGGAQEALAAAGVTSEFPLVPEVGDALPA